MNKWNQPIIFYDGVCGLCNRSVDFILRHDKRRQFLFAPLQGETAGKILEKEFAEDISSFILYANGKKYFKSTAALQVAKKIGGPFYLGVIFYIVPGFFRDFIYDSVAARRYSWFGRKEICRIIPEEEKKFFLP